MTAVTYLFVPGAGGVAAYWDLVVAELARRGIGALAVDLPGDDEAAGLAEYTDLVVERARAAGAGEGGRDLVIVGQSLGAFTASLAAARLPASLLVLVNGMVPSPGETVNDWGDSTQASEARRDNDIQAGRDPDAELDLATYFTHDVPPDIAEQVFATSRDEVETVFSSVWTLDAWPDVPTRVIAGADDRLFPAAFQQRVAQDRLGIAADVLPGGHLIALSHPVDLVDRLEAIRAGQAPELQPD